jgi:lysophospholipase L1-like esterase
MLSGSTILASSPTASPGYLALGDSIAFGYVADDGSAYFDAHGFVGYPDYAGRDLGLIPVNASCPGETSGTFRFAALNGDDNGCRSYRGVFPLHVSYSGTQLSFATEYLRGHPNTRLVTLGLGMNDWFSIQRACTGQTCLLAGLATMTANIDAILRSLRASGYKGVLEVVNYYAVDYTDTAQVGIIALFNKHLAASATAHHAVIADAFTAFETAAAPARGHTCAAGLINASPGPPDSPALPTCDLHPSLSGQGLLAATVEAAYLEAIEGGGGN